mmetsp:Transcript_103019/g.177717  ORF Transcript_103019/g.177717 Transcript_103019/m.177717 type:complete len:299 (-) Transcript_103019:1073-1969(-)
MLAISSSSNCTVPVTIVWPVARSLWARTMYSGSRFRMSWKSVFRSAENCAMSMSVTSFRFGSCPPLNCVAPMVTKDCAMRSKFCSWMLIKNCSTLLNVTGEIRPTIPKSMKPTRPSGSTSTFPACTSAWKLGQARTLPSHTFSALIRTSSGSARGAAFLIPARSVRGAPRKRSIVRTFSPLAAGYRNGALATPMLFVSRYVWNSRMFLASLRKSTSSIMLARISDRMSTSEARVRRGLRNSRTLAEEVRNVRSTSSTSSTPGFSTFTTTSFPLPLRVAACTCAMDAVANGVGSMDSYT